MLLMLNNTYIIYVYNNNEIILNATLPLNCKSYLQIYVMYAKILNISLL